MIAQGAVRALVAGAVVGGLGLTTMISGAEAPNGRYGGNGGYDGGNGGYGGRPDGRCKPGFGFGDRNHCHFGPPGLVRKHDPSGEDKTPPRNDEKPEARGDDGARDDAARQSRPNPNKANPAAQQPSRRHDDHRDRSGDGATHNAVPQQQRSGDVPKAETHDSTVPKAPEGKDTDDADTTDTVRERDGDAQTGKDDSGRHRGPRADQGSDRRPADGTSGKPGKR